MCLDVNRGRVELKSHIHRFFNLRGVKSIKVLHNKVLELHSQRVHVADGSARHDSIRHRFLELPEEKNKRQNEQ